jgi:hypothetical protein
VIFAEIVSDITRFLIAGHLASWAGAYPVTTNQPACTHREKRTQRPLAQIRSRAGRDQQGHLPCALVALQHSILIAICHMFNTDTT